MSTLAIVIIVVAVVIVIALVLAMPAARRRREAEQLQRRRTAAADSHREVAEDRLARARVAEKQYEAARADANLHEARADMIDRGLADDELAAAPSSGGRFERADAGADEPVVADAGPTRARQDVR